MALKRLGIPYTVVGTSEIDGPAMRSYEAIHGPVNQLGDITKLESLPECDLVTYSFPCLTGDMPVLTSKGYMPIRSIEPGDCVYSLDGKYHRVLASGCTGTQPTYRLKVKGHKEVRCTANHTFRVQYADGAIGWVPATMLDRLGEARVVACDGEDEDKPILSLWEVESVTPTNYAENVYDITVEGSESFVVNGLVTHNCQDLSVAGMQRGMELGSGTRSSLLWEVGRLIGKAVEDGHPPQCLLMENVDAILNQLNIDAFEAWIRVLEKLGYTSTYQVLNAVNYGVPQNRRRCFMVSYYGNLRYVFPEEHPTDRRLRDVLEDEVPESFYLSDEKIAKYEAHKRRHDAKGHGLGWKPVTPDQIGHPTTTKPDRQSQNFLITQGSLAEYRAEHEDDSESEDGASIVIAGKIDCGYDYRGRVYGDEGISPALNACGGGDLMPKIEVVGDMPQDYVQTRHVYSDSGVSPTVTAQRLNNVPKIEVKGHVEVAPSDEPHDTSLAFKGNITSMGVQSGRVYGDDGIAPTIPSQPFQGPTPLVMEDGHTRGDVDE